MNPHCVHTTRRRSERPTKASERAQNTSQDTPNDPVSFLERVILFWDLFCCGACLGPCGSSSTVFRPEFIYVSKAILGQKGLKPQYFVISGRPKLKPKKSCGISKKYLGGRISPPKVPLAAGDCIFLFCAWNFFKSQRLP